MNVLVATSPSSDEARVSVRHARFALFDVDCAGCARRALAALCSVPGVLSAEVQWVTERASITYDSRRTDATKLVAELTRAGFRSAPERAAFDRAARRACVARWVTCIAALELVVVAWASRRSDVFGHRDAIRAFFAAVALVACNASRPSSGGRNLRERLLIAAAVACFGMDAWPTWRGAPMASFTGGFELSAAVAAFTALSSAGLHWLYDKAVGRRDDGERQRSEPLGALPESDWPTTATETLLAAAATFAAFPCIIEACIAGRAADAMQATAAVLLCTGSASFVTVAPIVAEAAIARARQLGIVVHGAATLDALARVDTLLAGSRPSDIATRRPHGDSASRSATASAAFAPSTMDKALWLREVQGLGASVLYAFEDSEAQVERCADVALRIEAHRRRGRRVSIRALVAGARVARTARRVCFAMSSAVAIVGIPLSVTRVISPTDAAMAVLVETGLGALVLVYVLRRWRTPVTPVPDRPETARVGLERC